MLRSMLGIVAILAASASFALADPKDDIQAALQKLTDAGSYSWTTTIDAQGGGFGAGKQEGQLDKDGLLSVTTTTNRNGDQTTVQFVKKGDQVIVKDDDGWQTLDELNNGGGGNFMARRARLMQSPVATATTMLDELQNIQVADGVYSADVSDDGAKRMLTFGRRANADANGGPTVSNAKATAKFWITDGILTKSDIHVTGTVSFNGNDRDIDRTTTVEFKDVGSTTINLPPDALAKLTPPATQPAQ